MGDVAQAAVGKDGIAIDAAFATARCVLPLGVDQGLIISVEIESFCPTRQGLPTESKPGWQR
eukprot:6189442-Pyramimonas_sp.AAC.1